LDAGTVAISDTVENLLTLSAAAVAAADTITISGADGTVAQLVQLLAITGAKMPAYDVADSASALEAAVADEAKLELLDNAVSVIINTDASVAQVAAINEALASPVTGYTLADSAAALDADLASRAIVDDALVVKVSGTVTLAEIDAIADAYTATGLDATLGTQLVYTLTDTAGNILRGTVSTAGSGAAHTLADYQTGATSISITDEAVTVADAAALLLLGEFDEIYSINDDVAALDAGDAATLEGAVTVTVTDVATALISADGIAVRGAAVVDIVVVEDTLANLVDTAKFTEALQDDTSAIVITDNNLDIDDAAAVNALAAVADTTYSIIDTYDHLTTYASTALRTAGEALIAGAATVSVDDGTSLEDLTVTQFNTLDALTNATIVSGLTGTVAELTAANSATAVASALAAGAGGVTVTGPLVASVEEAATLVARGLPVSTIVVTDTAAAIQAAALNLVTGVQSLVVNDNGQLTLTVVRAEAIFDPGAAADGSSYGNYALFARADNLAALVGSNPALFQFANAVTASTAATALEAIDLTSVEAMGPVSFDVEDTASDLAAGPAAAALSKAGNITVVGNATVDRAEVIFALANGGTKTFSISDVAANFAATGGTAFANTATRSAILNASSNVAITDTADVATAQIVLNASNTGTTTISAVTDTATKVATLVLGSSENIGTITANTAAKVSEAVALVALDDANTTVVYDLADTAAALAGAGNAVLNGAGTITASTAATAAEAAVISAATANDANTVFDVTDTAADLAALASGVLNDARKITATTAATIAQAAKLTAATPGDGDTSFNIVDSFANIMADATPGGAVTNAAAVADAGTVTVTDASLTVAQAVALRAVSGTPTYVYSINDNDAAIVTAAGGAGSTALSGAVSVTGSQGTALSFATVGATPTFGITGTKAQLDALSSELAALNRIYKVSVADLEANPGFYSTLSGSQFLFVQDTAENLLSGNALLAGARRIVVDGEVDATQASQITALSALDTTSFVVRDTATALSGIAATGLNNATQIFATTDATLAEAANIAGATATAANTSYNVTGSISALVADATAVSVTGATNITATGTTTNVAHVTTLLSLANTGTTVIAAAELTAAEAAGLTFNATGDDKITALTVSGTATVVRATEILGDLTAGDLGSVTYSISDTAAELAKASAAVLDKATAITATTDVSLVLAATLDAASATDANTSYDIADSAANILLASAAALARGATNSGGQGNVINVTGVVTASQAADLIALDAANNTVSGNQTAAFQIAGATTVGSFDLEDSYAALMPAGVAAAGVLNASTVTVSGIVTAAQAAALDLASNATTISLAIKDTYSALFSATSTTRGLATSIEISNASISASQAATAFSWQTGATEAVSYSVASTASALATVLAGANAAAISSASAKTVTVSGTATVDHARFLSEVSKIAYTISDSAANIQAALDTANDLNVADRETILGAGSVSVTGFATVDEALGNLGNEERGLYTLGSKVTYSISDSGTSIAAALNGIDAAGIFQAQTVQLSAATSADYTMSVADAEAVTALDQFRGADHDSNAATARIYNVSDTVANISSGNDAVISGASVVTATGAATAETIDFSAFGRGLTIDGGDGSDIIFGTDFADVIIGGVGADILTGGTGADTFVFAGGDSGTISGTVFDVITDFTIADGDLLDLAGSATVRANATGVDVKAAVTGATAIDAAVTSGVITLTGADSAGVDTLAEWLAVARIVVTSSGEAAAFVFGGDTYVYQENSGGDLLIQLDNVTGITLGLAAAANTVVLG
jgi:hypothetical protein